MGIIKTPFTGQLFMKMMKTIVARHWYKVALCESNKDKSYLKPILSAFKEGTLFQLADAYQQILRLDGTPLIIPHDALVI